MGTLAREHVCLADSYVDLHVAGFLQTVKMKGGWQ